MLPPWSRPLEVDRLADGGADVDFAIPLAELSGLRPQRAGVAGTVRGRAHFTRERGLAVARLTLEGSATLECQRCMQPLEFALNSQVRVALLHSEAEAARVPEELEPVLAPGGRISIGELITEELLLSLPIVPLHEGNAGCASAPEAAPDPQADTHRPFAQLADLLKR
jgi:uncharacterized protein